MIIGICGLIGSGKDTVANLLIHNHNFHKTSFADKLKDAVASMFEWDRYMLEGKTEPSREWRESPDPFWSKEIGHNITPRYVLQRFGTECMRHGFYDGIWVSLTKKQILENPDINWIIPDVRFPNEVKMIKEIGGHMWRISRGDDPGWFTGYKRNGHKPSEIHPSEYMWANTDFDWLIDNNSSIDDLSNKVNQELDPLVSTLFQQDATPVGN